MSQLTPECPVSEAERKWLDSRMAWLGEAFGADRMAWATVPLANDEFFPDDFDGSEEDARVLLATMCAFIGMEPDTVELCFFDDRPAAENAEQGRGTAGLSQSVHISHRVHIDASSLDDPLVLVAAMARELARALLIGSRRTSQGESDREPLIDLLAVFLGFGVLTANTALREKYIDQGYESRWHISRRGYLSMAMYGYALALFARARIETNPTWMKELRPDVRDSFEKSMAYLGATNEAPYAAAAPEEQPPFPMQGGLPEPEPTEEVEAIEVQRLVCSYCNAPISKAGHGAGQVICVECQHSIDMNLQAMAEAGMVGDARVEKLLKFALFCVLFGVVVFVLLPWFLGVIRAPGFDVD